MYKTVSYIFFRTKDKSTELLRGTLRNIRRFVKLFEQLHFKMWFKMWDITFAKDKDSEQSVHPGYQGPVV